MIKNLLKISQQYTAKQMRTGKDITPVQPFEEASPTKRPFSNKVSDAHQTYPVKLTFKNVCMEVSSFQFVNGPDNQKVKTLIKHKILKGVSGLALPGQTTYIMGSSGAGKTSLLNILSDRISKRNGTNIEGTVNINDTIPLNDKVFGDFAAYVMQDDILYEFLTPREALIFAARLKLGGDEDQKLQRVNEVLEELGLISQQNTLIGSVKMKTLSGGERKRVAIGVEMITNPSLLLLDEPTSGLDSFKALSIVKLLDKQAKKGKTVIATLHQPSSEAFKTFDRLILMVDGNIAFQGKASESVSHFARIGFNCPIHSNPADFFMKILSVNYPKTEEDEKVIKTLVNGYDTKYSTKNFVLVRRKHN
ncbi:hypothetical protein FGO68_gene14291 [Halteria grandinella]|uniref:ABC transporter domain-containing protein n=1 Tax=Halteria grandinella TaxID=5974 RepID=A0A8J8NUL0_HALGN|nr:hypothetical protein FGO68_gene14291 [Halteria grandinella]